MYFTNSNYTMGGNFKILKQAPMDNRSTVSKLIDLSNPNIFDGYTYNGMIVSVTEDGDNNGLYRLENKSILKWELVGSTSSTVVEFSSLTPEQIEQLKGEDGKSIYEVAKDNGYTGTVEEYLNSIKGKSAYEIAKDNGYTGTEEEWLESLTSNVNTENLVTKTAYEETINTLNETIETLTEEVNSLTTIVEELNNTITGLLDGTIKLPDGSTPNKNSSVGLTLVSNDNDKMVLAVTFTPELTELIEPLVINLSYTYSSEEGNTFIVEVPTITITDLSNLTFTIDKTGLSDNITTTDISISSISNENIDIVNEPINVVITKEEPEQPVDPEEDDITFNAMLVPVVDNAIGGESYSIKLIVDAIGGNVTNNRELLFNIKYTYPIGASGYITEVPSVNVNMNSNRVEKIFTITRTSEQTDLAKEFFINIESGDATVTSNNIKLLITKEYVGDGFIFD